MAQPFVAEIRIFPFNFAPVGWALCNGQAMRISQNTALFSLLGVNFGGDGRSTFGLPNLQGNVPVNAGQGPGLSLYNVGQSGGSPTVKLLDTQMPAHNHTLRAQSGSATTTSPVGAVPATTSIPTYAAPGGSATLNAGALQNTGGSLPHNNLQPYLVLNFCIALQGVFPPRS